MRLRLLYVYRDFLSGYRILYSLGIRQLYFLNRKRQKMSILETDVYEKVLHGEKNRTSSELSSNYVSFQRANF